MFHSGIHCIQTLTKSNRRQSSSVEAVVEISILRDGACSRNVAGRRCLLLRLALGNF
jgi:hypothetical protein